ncbi:MAG TPA: ABC transporter permease [Ensifer sp.]|jgi:macrolide transport system ATP-binding/permease protein|uniref:ABC transporter permease n=1 Tax=Ensifer sp. TaxID=1872086 RepID=UPI002E1557C7|nr:ABC transporter permease [Ensifer sp.]
MIAPRLEVSHVTRTYRSGDETVMALNDVSLVIEPGELVAIVGASGSGKSTLMNILGCLDRTDGGTYRVDGIDVSNLEADAVAHLRRDRFGFVFQRYHLVNALSVAGNVELPAIYAGTPAARRRERAARLVDQFGLADKLLFRPNELSGGQQQRIAIARALMNDAGVVLADEPTGALDRRSGELVLSALKELHQQGRTVIIVTHDHDVASHAGRIIEIADGAIVSDTCLGDRREGSAQTENTRAASRSSSTSIASLTSAFGMSFKAMAAQKLRTGLTMLGIVIGVTAVVAVIGLGEGARISVRNQMAGLGTNTLVIYPGRSFGDPEAHKIVSLTTADVDALAAQPYVDSATPEIATNLKARNGARTVELQVVGIGSSYFRANGMKLVSGRLLMQEDLAEANSNVVLSEPAVPGLFGSAEPVGKQVLLGKTPATVVGVVALPHFRGGAASAYMTHTALRSRVTGPMPLANITLRVRDDIDTTLAERAASNLLQRRHGVKDFFIFNNDQVRRASEKTMATFSLLIAALAAVALVVGGIGVMNIMLISVTERTREIGLRMALGARRRDIMAQFMIEAVAVCVVGGGFGVALAIALSFVSDALMSPLPIVLSAGAILLATGFTIMIGLAFGYLPARGAARLDPVRALASE